MIRWMSTRHHGRLRPHELAKKIEKQEKYDKGKAERNMRKAPHEVQRAHYTYHLRKKPRHAPQSPLFEEHSVAYHFYGPLLQKDLSDLPLLECPLPIYKEDEHPDPLDTILQNGGYIGVDTESKPCFHAGDKSKTSLIQIATPTSVYLYRLEPKQPLTDRLHALLQAPNVIIEGSH